MEPWVKSLKVKDAKAILAAKGVDTVNICEKLELLKLVAENVANQVTTNSTANFRKRVHMCMLVLHTISLVFLEAWSRYVHYNWSWVEQIGGSRGPNEGQAQDGGRHHRDHRPRCEHP